MKSYLKKWPKWKLAFKTSAPVFFLTHLLHAWLSRKILLKYGNPFYLNYFLLPTPKTPKSGKPFDLAISNHPPNPRGPR